MLQCVHGTIVVRQSVDLLAADAPWVTGVRGKLLHE